MLTTFQLLKSQSVFVVLIFTLLIDSQAGAQEVESTKTLMGTTWNSTFYHYNRYYAFETDSTGYWDLGQVAWSCPVDTLQLGISGDKILYSDLQSFNYRIKNDTLFLIYEDENSERDSGFFIYQPERGDWISNYEFVYGKEVLRRGKKQLKFYSLD